MNTRDEVIEALKGNRGDTAPPAIFTQTGTVGQMDDCGASWPDANYDLDKMVRLALQPHQMFGFATAKVPFDITVESGRLGAEVFPGTKGSQPSIQGSPFISDDVPDVPSFMSPEEFVSGGRCKLVADAADKIRRENADVFTISGCIDPFSISYLLTGVDNFLMGMLMDPEKCKAWIDAMTPMSVEFVRVLSENSDDVQIIAEASSEIIPPESFDEFVAEPVKKMIAAAKGFTTVHSCGETSEVLDSLADLGADGLSLETAYDPQGIYDRIAGRTRLLGGIPAVDLLLQGTPQNIINNAKMYSDIGYALITPECGVPPRTPNENMKALSHYRC